MAPQPINGLHDLRVVEVDGGVAVSFATKLLADIGADVVKLEPAGGDPVRERAGLFAYLNTNKRSRLDTPAARAELSARADLVIGGPSGMELAGGHPALVTCAVTPFGLSGPYATYRATELAICHGGGWAWLSPGASPWPERPPLRPFGHQAELQAGIGAATVALAAAGRAAATGTGEQIDYSMQSHIASMLEAAFIAWSYSGWDADRLGVRTLNPWKIFRCRDGLIFHVSVEQDQWERLVELMGSPEWAQEEIFATAADRNANADVLAIFLEQWTEQQSLEWLWHEGQRRRICFAPVFHMADLEAQPHLAARRFFVSVPAAGPVAGETGSEMGEALRLPGPPARLEPELFSLRSGAPVLHQHETATFPAAADRRPAPPGARPGPAGRPLDGVRVVDFSWVWAGPFAGLQLAHLGADVIKVESGARLCLGRRLPFHPPGVAPTHNTSGYFNQWNQAKRSIEVDLRDPRGVELVRRLIGQADVVLDNFAVGVMDRLGLGAVALRDVKADLIVASITGYGQTGPCRQYVGYGPTAAPLAGLADLTGYPGEGPSEVGIAFGDPACGIAAAWAIVAALAARARDGQGRRIDVSMWEAALAFQPDGWMFHALGEPAPPRMGNRDTRWAPHNCYRCAEDPSGPHPAGAWLTIACPDEAAWQGLCSVVGRGLADDRRFADAAGRKAHEEELDEVLAAWAAGQDRWSATRALQAAGVAAFPSLSPADLERDPHLAARGFIERLDHPEVGRRAHTGVPWLLHRGPNGVRSPAPLLGQHTDEVLRELVGLDDAAIAALRRDDVVGG